MNTLPLELFQLIAEPLKYKDFLQFKLSCKRIARSIDPLLYTKRLEIKNYLQIWAVKGDLDFLEFVEKEDKLISKDQNDYLPRTADTKLLIAQNEEWNMSCFAGIFSLTLSKTKGISLKTFEWFKSRDIQLWDVVLEDQEILRQLQDGYLVPDVDLFYNLLRAKRKKSLGYVLSHAHVDISNRVFCVKDAMILKEWTKLDDSQIVWKNDMITGDLEALKWILEETQIAKTKEFVKVIKELDGEVLQFIPGYQNKKDQIMKMVKAYIPNFTLDSYP